MLGSVSAQYFIISDHPLQCFSFQPSAFWVSRGSE